MAEGTYENECNRAELLGLNPPDRIEWEEAERVRKENEQTEQLAEIDNQDEKLTENSGKMDEINSILSMTQMRLNKFKKACGSLTNLLKVRSGSDTDTSDSLSSENVENSEKDSNTDNKVPKNDDPDVLQSIGSVKKTSNDIQEKMTSHLDKLDALLTKSENAQYAMAQQNKEMKSMKK